MQAAALNGLQPVRQIFFGFFFSPIHFVPYSDHVLNSIVLVLLAITTKRVT